MSGVPITIPSLPSMAPDAADLIPAWDTSLGLTGRISIAALNTLLTSVGGDWTPELRFGGAAPVGITGSLVGAYSRIGSLVTITGQIALTSKGAQVGNAAIYGLPYAVASGPKYNGALALHVGGNFAYTGTMSVSITNGSLVMAMTVVNNGVGAFLTNT